MRAPSQRVTVFLLGACAAAPAFALPLTLDTTWLDANATLSLSPVAQQTLALTGITASASGKASNLGGGAFNLPVSKLAVDVGILPPRLSVLTADVKGSALTFSSNITQTSTQLANLSLDYQKRTIFGDLISAGVSSRIPVFSFDVLKPLSFSLSGGISVNLSLGNIHFTNAGARSFAAALKIPDVLVPTFTSLNFGTLDAKVVPWFRQPVSSMTAVPEPSRVLMLVTGLLGLGLLSRVRRA